MSKIISEIRKELKGKVDLKYKKGFAKYFNDEVKNYGVRTPYVRSIGRKYFKKVKQMPKVDIFILCNELLQSNISEESTIAFQWISNLKKQYESRDFVLFERWLNKYVNNWAKCDDFCTHALGNFLLQFPEFLPRIKEVWAVSKNRWVRRGAAVILIPVVKKDKSFLKDVFEISDILLLDKDDLVQKGYGWLLKEAGNKYQKEVFDYVMKHKNYMPRTSLRYVIEKMPPALKKQAMTK